MAADPTWLVFAEILVPSRIYLALARELTVFSVLKATKLMASARFLLFGGVLDGSNRSSTGGRTHARQRTGVPRVWPLMGLPMTPATTICLNPAGRAPPGRQRLRGKPASAKRNLA